MRALVAFSGVLALATSASAEGAWTLWMTGASSPWDSVGTFSMRELCMEALHQQAQAVEKLGLKVTEDAPAGSFVATGADRWKRPTRWAPYGRLWLWAAKTIFSRAIHVPWARHEAEVAPGSRRDIPHVGGSFSSRETCVLPDSDADRPTAVTAACASRTTSCGSTSIRDGRADHSMTSVACTRSD
jgi:hypothetical protein